MGERREFYVCMYVLLCYKTQSDQTSTLILFDKWIWISFYFYYYSWKKKKRNTSLIHQNCIFLVYVSVKSTKFNLNNGSSLVLYYLCRRNDSWLADDYTYTTLCRRQMTDDERSRKTGMEFTHSVEFSWLFCEANISWNIKYYENGCGGVSQRMGGSPGWLQTLRGKVWIVIYVRSLNIILSSVFMEFKCVVLDIFDLQPVDGKRHHQQKQIQWCICIDVVLIRLVKNMLLQ